ncbi:hypothetical protein [Oceanobacillus picturae]|uniref:hypothetical protein n=1 Tax=Oceanobacillus picturae TaxID=171693 RepID=UPI00056BB5D7|nr:hypothetical protein [Oceanobacillus picturae]
MKQFCRSYVLNNDIPLTHIDPIVSEEQVDQISDKINLWYDFYERSLIWRFGHIPVEWKEGEKEALEH